MHSPRAAILRSETRTILFRRGRRFLQALSFARSHRDSWLEATTTLNLGFIAMQVNHYDEAVDWSNSAYQEATRFGYENTVEGAAGNLGWAYFQLGDDERALETI